MSYLQKTFFILAVSATISLVPFFGVHAAGTVGVSTGFDYSSGDYGGDSNTDMLYVPFSLKYQNDFSSYKLTIPYLSITTEEEVVGGGSDVILVDSNGGTTREKETESGLGDIFFKATYFLFEGSEELPAIPMVDLIGKIKFPTADEEKGLGTGEFDYYLQTDLTWIVGSKIAVFSSLGYKIYGSPEEYELNNALYGSLGAAYQIKKGLSAGLMYDARQASTDTGSDVGEATLYVSKKFSEKIKMLLYGVKGFSDGSADYGVGLNLSYAMDIEDIDWSAPMKILSDIRFF